MQKQPGGRKVPDNYVTRRTDPDTSTLQRIQRKITQVVENLASSQILLQIGIFSRKTGILPINSALEGGVNHMLN